ncbi:type III secretion system export apparatus subunit SctU [Bremerella sp. JC770]|uniref:type III secretion system export apparatus subunit SctU n=1 Tax=Bremerella sp. JC770 TaxID=3232137 RepID=UPI003457E590
MSGEKTEQPTQKRLRDARKKGQVAHSKEVSSTATLLGVFAYFLFGHRWIHQQVMEMMVLPTQYLNQPFSTAFSEIIIGVALYMGLICGPVIAIIIVVGIGTNYLQVGPLFSIESITPKLEKLNPAEKFKQIFSVKNFVEFAKSNFKVAFLGILIYYLIRSSIPTLVYSPFDGLPGVVRILNHLMFSLAMVTSFAYIVIATADYFFQKKQYRKQLMMTKSEVKQEHKENEGDPQIKSKRRQLHRELANDEAIQKTKQSTVLVTNPTHFAVALYYEKGITQLPITLVKGKGDLALRMISAAKDDGIPIVRNIPLARALYADADIDRFIPKEFIAPVAEVLRIVLNMRKHHEISDSPPVDDSD